MIQPGNPDPAQTPFRGRTVPHLFEARVQQTPQAPALLNGEAQLSYQALNHRANQIAHHLQRSGLRPGATAAICHHRRTDMVAAILAVLKLGAAYVPMDPAYPAERLAYTLNNANTAFLLTQTDLNTTLPPTQATIVHLDQITDGPTHNPTTPIHPEMSSHIIYTSGSTGQPKGVIIPHAAVTALIDWMAETYTQDDLHRVAAVTSICFDLSIFEILGTLCLGGTCVLLDHALALPQTTHPITLINTVPSAITELLAQNAVPPTTRVINLAGEPLRNALAQGLYTAAPNARLYNLYGPTEDTTYTTAALVPKNATHEPTIGRPLPGTQIHLSAPDGRPVPAGQTGELCTAGAGLATGYLNQPAATAEKFTPNPFGPSGSRLYHTGDLAQLQPNGELAYLGRRDHQVKIRGFRIELGEIEAALLNAGIRETVVIAHGQTSQRRLVAYIATHQTDHHALTQHLRQTLSATLPAHMVPAQFICAPALPHTPNGKIDRKALPHPTPVSNAAYRAPTTPQQSRLTQLWAEVLQLNPQTTGVDDHFFQLGGNSLTIARLLNKLQTQMNAALTPVDLFNHPTPAQLAQRLNQQTHAPIIPPLPQTHAAQTAPSYAQRRLWFIEQLGPTHGAYHLTYAFHLRGPLNPAHLTQALNQIIERHPPLRTIFTVQNGEPRAALHPGAQLSLTQLKADPGQDINSLLFADHNRPFDLSRDLMLRARLIQRAPQDHFLALTLHHIAFDGWSLGVFITELTHLYNALTHHTTPPAAPVQTYAQYAAWQHQDAMKPVYHDQLAWWRDLLEDAPPLHNLPLDHPRPSRQSYQGATAVRTIDADTTHHLRRLALTHGATLNTVLQAAFAALLSRYSRTHDIVFGSVNAGRGRDGLADLIGFFVNTQVMRHNTAGDPTFIQLLERAKTVTHGALTHADLPFDLLVDDLKPQRDLSYNPLFQIMFVLQNNVEPPLQLHNITAQPVPAPNPAALFDLTLEIAEHPLDLTVTWEYDTHLFEAHTINTMADLFTRLLNQITQNPHQPLSRWDLLDAEQRTRLLQTDTSTKAPQDARCAHHLFQAHAQTNPDATAVVFEDQTLTYAQLNARANRIAHTLREMRVGQGQLVGLYVRRSIDMAAGLLGVLKAGAAYVPLDPRYPADRLAHMIQDADCVVILSHDDLAQSHLLHNRRVLHLDHPHTHAATDHNPAAAVSPHHPAYVIYTSGSTGKPKGVQLHHRGLVNMVHDAPVLNLTRDSRMLQFASFSFDAATWEWATALCNGAALILCRAELTTQIDALTRLIQDQRVTHALLPPALLPHLDPAQLSGLQDLVVGGDKCDWDQALRWSKDRNLWNYYGPTEITVYATRHRIDPQTDTRVLIGKAMPGARTYVLDQHLNLTPPGVPGELCLAGEGAAHGYRNQPSLTAQAFVPNPFSPTPGDRLYRTGDLVRTNPTGQLIFLGRIDHQIKIRGFRIEVGEIEAQLLRHTVVQEAHVQLNSQGGRQFLVAYVVAPNLNGDHAQLQGHLSAALPDYMIPAAFVVMDAFPLTRNGKLDRKALPAPDLSGAYTAPATPMEQELAAVWAEVLGLDPHRIGSHDNFFSLGGDSILSIQVVARARRRDLHLSTRLIFEHQTITALAPHVATGRTGPAISQAPAAGAMPPLPIHRHFFAQNHAAAHHYNQAYLLYVPEGLTANHLTTMTAALIQRHDALRLIYTPTPDGIDAHFGDAANTAAVISVADVRGMDPQSRRDHIAAHAHQTQAELEPAAGVLFKLVLFEAETAQASRLLMVCHHLIVDGVSWRILLQDLSAAFNALQTSRPIQLAPKTTSVQDWSQRLHREAAQFDISYWQNLSFPAPLPGLETPPADTTLSRADVLTLTLDAARTDALLGPCAKPYRTRINDLLLTALALGFNRWCGARRLHLDLEGHGRENLYKDLDLSETVGWFTSLYPVVLTLPDDDHPGTLIKTVKEQLRTVPHNGIGYGIQRFLNHHPDLQHQPAAPIVFNYLGRFDQGARRPFDMSFEPAGRDLAPQNQMLHPLSFNGWVEHGRLTFTLDYHRDLFTPQSVSQLAQHIQTALETIVDHCSRRDVGGFTPSDFPLAAGTPTQTLVDAWAGQFPHLQDVYAATPMQQGLLYHALIDPSGAYITQLEYRLKPGVDPQRFKAAWGRLIARYDIFRTAFIGHHGEAVQQVVVGDVKTPFRILDWRDLNPDEAAHRYRTFLTEDRLTPHDPARPCLMRLVLIHLPDQDRFVWNHHHALLDGWSLPLVLDELQTLVQHPHTDLPSITPYRRYAAWLQAQDRAETLAWWRAYLAGVEAPTPLLVEGIDLDPNDVDNAYLLTLSPEHSAACRNLAAANGLTLNILIQGAFALLLQQYSGQDRVVFGVTGAGRPADLEGVERMVGLFLYTLPAVVNPNPGATLRTFLHDLSADNLAREERGFLPLVDIQGCSAVTHDTPLFDLLYVFENYPYGEDQGEKLLQDQIANEKPHYGLSVAVLPFETISISFNYNPARYAAAVIQALAAHLTHLLHVMPAYLDQPLATLPALSEDQIAQRRAWNQTQLPFPADVCIHQQVESQAAATPEAAALIYEDQTLTYAQLNARANRVAHVLRTQGVTTGQTVGLALERGPDMIIGLLGILKAGAAYLPLDPHYPAGRLAHMLDDAGVSLVLSHTHLNAQLPLNGRDVLNLDQPQHFAEAADTNLDPHTIGLDAGCPAYMIYTSGSTGKPKGVTLHHRGLLNLAAAQSRAFLVTPEERVLQFASISFDAATSEWAMALTVGAALHLIPETTAKDMARLSDVIRKHRITIATLPPVLLPNLDPDQLSGLKVLVVAGEACPPALMRRWAPGRTFINAYGPSECTVCATLTVCEPNRPLTIGGPIQNTVTHVLNPRLQPVPVGVPGQLFIGGVGLAYGYHNRPDLTAQAFIPNPFAAQDGVDRLYRTGDRVRRLPNGQLEFLERLDHQVKIRGFRIELGEIEAVLMDHADIREAAVLVRGEGQRKQLTAYLVATGQQADLTEALTQHLTQNLPSHMVPTALIFLDAMPLTPNGKLDRKALPDPEQRTRQRIAPRNAAEAALLTLFAEILELPEEDLSVDDHFFRLGGHSLSAMRLIGRIKRAFNQELPLSVLFANPTPAAAARHLDGPTQTAPLTRRNPDTPAVLSYPQQRLFFIENLGGMDGVYNISSSWRIAGTPDADALDRALCRILNRHQVLRTVFTTDGETTTPAVLPVPPTLLRVINAAHTKPEALDQQISDELNRPFDLSQDLMLRAAMFQRTGEALLYLTMHHIAADGWSFDILHRELGAFYNGGDLPEPRVQYADFAAWQRTQLTPANLQTHLNWWAEHLADAPVVHDLSLDHPRPQRQRYQGALHHHRIEGDLSTRLEQCAQSHEATPFMLVQALFAAFLHRYSTADDILFGVPIAGRTPAEVEDLIGFFVNTLVLRHNLTGNPAFQDHLAHCRQIALNAFAHQTVPFEMLVDHLNPQRDLSHAPLFQIMLLLETETTQPLTLGDHPVTPAPQPHTVSKFDLTLAVKTAPTHLTLTVEYNTHLFAPQTMARMTAHFENLTRAVLKDPTTPIQHLQLLSPEERKHQLVTWNQTQHPYPADQCLHQLFETTASQKPTAKAVVHQDQTLTYAQLNRRADRLAAELKARGAGPETFIGLCVTRTPEMIMGMLAILKSGAAYVPLDPAYPADRLTFILNDTKAPLVLIQPHLATHPALKDRPLLTIPKWDTHFSDSTKGDTHFSVTDSAKGDTHLSSPEPAKGDTHFSNDPSRPAYVIYTSGSTGQPKGVVIEHRNAVALCAWGKRYFQPEDFAGVAAFTSMCFDLSIFECFVTLSAGGTVVLMDKPLDLIQAATRHPVTLLNTVPSIARALIEEAALPPTLRVALYAGEPLPADLVRATHALAPNCRVHNLWAPSETTTYSTCAEVDGQTPPPIGYPLDNETIYILDPHLQPVPIGVPGEIWVGGAGVARGYLHRDDLTREKFRPDPFSRQPNARMYRTGDLGQWLPNGAAAYLRRMDSLVKVRGFRIELGEIETRLLESPGVRQAAVIVIGPENDRRLAAYLVPQSMADPQAQIQACRDHLQCHLPDYMVPAHFTALESLPKTNSGKLDRKALPQPNQTRQTQPMAPRTATERRLVQLWADLLNRPAETIGVSDNFFNLGGHSLAAMRLTARIQRTLTKDLSLTQLFQAPTIAAVAAILDDAPAPRTPNLTPRPNPDAPAPLSFSQQRLWFLESLGDVAGVYHIPLPLHLQGPLNIQRLTHALTQIIDRHQVLRTRFTQSNGKVTTQVQPTTPFQLPVQNTADLTPAQRKERLQAAVDHPFDLTRDLMLRATLYQHGPKDHTLLLVLHHIAADGWSLDLLLTELNHLYQGHTPPPLPCQYADFALWQRRHLQENALQTSLNYWSRQLADLPPVHDLPLDRPRPAQQRFDGALHQSRLPGTLRAAVDALCKARNVTPFMLMQAAFAVFLGRAGRTRDVVFGTPIAGRNPAPVTDLIGFFVNTLVLRTNLTGRPTFNQLLARCRQTALDAYAHQDLPFEMLVDHLQPQRDLSYSPLFQIMLLLESDNRPAPALGDLHVTPIEPDHRIAKFDLTLAVTLTDDALDTAWEYNTDLFNPATIAAMADAFEVLLQAALQNPDTPVDHLPLMSPKARGQVICQGNSIQTTIPMDRHVHQIIANQAHANPQTPALITATTTMTYGELIQAADRVAHVLRDHGVGPDHLVGIAVPRSIPMIVAQLAVLRAGGAYVPIDANVPADRLQFMLEDTRLSLVLTTADFKGDLQNVTPINLDDLNRFPERGPLPGDTGGDLPQRLVYMIYTSGSTGRPKGVMIHQAGLLNYLHDAAHTYGAGAGRGAALITPLAFDASVTATLLPLTQGQPIHLPPEGEELTWLQNLEHSTQSFDWMKLTPAHLAALKDKLPQCLRTTALIVGGEALKPHHVTGLFNTRVRIFNEYGPTETVVGSAVHEVPHAAPEGEIPIGEALANTQLYILDHHGRPTPPGFVGELFIGGAGVARGYWGRPGLTAERFIPDPFNDQPGARLYRTGDLVRRPQDGVLHYLGRVDHQVKVRGYRIELGEIETALTRHPSLSEAVVQVIGEGDHKQLAAYVVANPTDETELFDDLRRHLRQTLPDYMVPTLLMQLDTMPLTQNGKVDRRALPKPQAQTTHTAPTTPLEHQLRAVWAEVLGRDADQIGIHDNFFSLGGDSILSIQVVAAARRRGIQLTTRQLFEHQTIQQLARHAHQDTGPHFPQAPALGTTPLLPIQRWFFNRNHARPHHVNQASLLRAPAALDQAALKVLLHALIQRHDALRLRFQPNGTDVIAQFHQTVDLDEVVTVIDLGDQKEDTRQTAVDQAADQAQASLDHVNGPLFKAVLFAHQSDPRLLLVFHHLIIDGVSWRILLADLARAWTQHHGGEPIQLPPKTSTIQAWAEACTQAAPTLDADFWIHQAAQDPPPFPGARRRPADNTLAHTLTRQFTLDPQTTADLLGPCAAPYRTQINELLLAALLHALRGRHNLDRVRIDLEGHGREALFNHIDLSETVGWFTSLYPLTLSAPQNADLDALIKAVKEQVRAVPKSGLTYGLSRYLANRPELQNDPPAPILFNYLGRFDDTADTADFALLDEPRGRDISPHNTRSHALVLTGAVVHNQLQFTLDFHRDQFDETHMTDLLDHYRRALETLVQHCRTPNVGGPTPSDFPLAAGRPKQAHVDAWITRYPNLEDVYAATAMQRGLIFHTQLDTAGHAYNTQLEFRLSPTLDHNRFRDAWRQIIERHVVFRTAFAGQGVVDLQQIPLSQVPLPWADHDLRRLDTHQAQAQYQQLQKADQTQTFDFSAGCPMRLILVRLPFEDRFIWNHHHALLDGWSVPIVLTELIHAYQTGSTAALPEVRPYRDYAAWLARRDHTAAQTWWREQLGDFRAPTRILVEGLDLEPGASHDQHLAELPAQLSADLRALAAKHHLTLNVLLQAACALLLQRYSGEEDVVYGVTSAGRPPDLPGVESMVGLFLNTLPARAVINADQDVLSYLHETSAQNLSREEHGALPLVEIQACSAVPRGHALFDVLYVFENYPIAEADPNAEDLLTGLAANEKPHYGLTLAALPTPNIGLRISYQNDRFSHAAVARLGDHFQQILTAFVAHPNAALASIALPTPAERHTQMVTWNQVQTFPATECLHQRFERAAATHPHQGACLYEDQTLTYNQLNQRANQVAHLLRSKGVGPDSLVGLAVTRSLDMIVGLLGILKAGGAYVPLDPVYPPDRLTYMAQDAALKLVLTQSTLPNLFPTDQITTLDLDRPEHFQHQPTHNLPAQQIGLNPAHAAYVIYTSGSTGQPKGVVVQHNNVTRLFDSGQAQYQFGPEDTWTLFHSYAFDFSVWEIWGALFYGGRLIIVPHQTSRSPEAFYRLLGEQRVTVLNQTPSAFYQLIPIALRGDTPHALRCIIFGGEALDPRKLKPWMDRFGEVRPQLINMYGITETTVHVTYRPLTAADCLEPDSMIGAWLPDLTGYVLDPHLNPVPIGVPGELYVGGAGLARGYLNRDQLTRERFIPHPFQPEGRLYKTGDLVRFLNPSPRGKPRLEYMGRIDHQVKLRGFRIELGEIEARLKDHPAVDQAVVGLRGEGEYKRLVAWLVPNHAIQAPDLIAQIPPFLKESLPDYMIPAHFSLLDMLPLTRNGKVDQHALPEPDATTAAVFEPLETQTEKIVGLIWSEVLQLEVDRIGRSDHFFQLGGHSLLATAAVAKITAHFEIDLSLAEFFGQDNLAELAKRIDVLKWLKQGPQGQDDAPDDDDDDMETLEL